MEENLLTVATVTPWLVFTSVTICGWLALPGALCTMICFPPWVVTCPPGFKIVAGELIRTVCPPRPNIKDKIQFYIKYTAIIRLVVFFLTNKFHCEEKKKKKRIRAQLYIILVQEISLQNLLKIVREASS